MVPRALKKAPQTLCFIRFSQSLQFRATRSQKASISAYYSRSKSIFQKIKFLPKFWFKWSTNSCSKSIFQEWIFSVKGFSFSQLYSNAKSIKFILQNSENYFQSRRQIEAPYWFLFRKMISKNVFPFGAAICSPNQPFSQCWFCPSRKSIWSFYLPSEFDFLFCGFSKTWKSIWSSYLQSKFMFFWQGISDVANFAETL